MQSKQTCPPRLDTAGASGERKNVQIVMVGSPKMHKNSFKKLVKTPWMFCVEIHQLLLLL